MIYRVLRMVACMVDNAVMALWQFCVALTILTPLCAQLLDYKIIYLAVKASFENYLYIDSFSTLMV